MQPDKEDVEDMVVRVDAGMLDEDPHSSIALADGTVGTGRKDTGGEGQVVGADAQHNRSILQVVVGEESKWDAAAKGVEPEFPVRWMSLVRQPEAAMSVPLGLVAHLYLTSWPVFFVLSPTLCCRVRPVDPYAQYQKRIPSPIA